MAISGNAFIDDLDYEGAASYLELRPSYPKATLEILGRTLSDSGTATFESDGSAFLPELRENHYPGDSNAQRIAVDIGAGSGQLTRLLAMDGYRTIAVEPSDAMRKALLSQPWVEQTGTVVVDGMAEDTGLPDHSADLVTWAQCFHWLDVPRATAEAVRILRPGGVASAIWNQLDVRQPWVHRLTRIMRSGDVLERQRPPQLGEDFSAPLLDIVEWTDRQTPEQVLELGKTRSSYIRANKQGKAKMQENLRWYLFDRLGFFPGEPIELPYRTFVWTAIRL